MDLVGIDLFLGLLDHVFDAISLIYESVKVDRESHLLPAALTLPAFLAAGIDAFIYPGGVWSLGQHRPLQGSAPIYKLGQRRVVLVNQLSKGVSRGTNEIRCLDVTVEGSLVDGSDLAVQSHLPSWCWFLNTE